jgi:hypothetical protein
VLVRKVPPAAGSECSVRNTQHATRNSNSNSNRTLLAQWILDFAYLLLKVSFLTPLNAVDRAQLRTQNSALSSPRPGTGGKRRRRRRDLRRRGIWRGIQSQYQYSMGEMGMGMGVCPFTSALCEFLPLLKYFPRSLICPAQ